MVIFTTAHDIPLMQILQVIHFAQDFSFLLQVSQLTPQSFECAKHALIYKWPKVGQQATRGHGVGQQHQLPALA